MLEKQKNERRATRFDGVYQRASRVKRHEGKPDICYSIDYRDPATGKRIRSTIGWLSKGITAAYANTVRNNLIERSNKAKFSGVAPLEEKDIPSLNQAWALYERDWLLLHGIKSAKNDESIYRNHLQDSLGDIRLHHITGRDIEMLAASVIRKGRSPQTARHTLALLRRIINKIIDWKLWTGPTPFTRDLKLPRVNNERQRYLTPHEAQCLLEALRGINTRMWLFSLISLHCGLRFGEIAALRRNDIDFDAETLFVRDPKSGRDRFAIMTTTVKNALAYMTNKSPSALLFPTQTGKPLRWKDGAFDDVIEAFEFNSGVDDTRQKVVFHTLRHTYASWLAKNGESMNTIADLLGHSVLEMSRRYTHLMPDTKRKAAQQIDNMFNDEVHMELQK